MANALTNSRGVSVTFGEVFETEIFQSTVPLDFYKGSMDLVRKIEDKITKLGAANVPNNLGTVVRFTGSTPYNLYEAFLTSDSLSGTYNFRYSNTYENSDQVIEGMMM